MPTLKPVAKAHKLIPFINFLGSVLFLPNLLRRRAFRAADLRAAKRILWVNIKGFGDLALATRALASMRQCFPDAHITLLVQPQTRGLIEQCPWVDEILTVTVPWSHRTGKYHPKRYLSSEFIGLLRDLRRRHFDLAIDGHMDIRNNLLLAMTGAPRRLGFDYDGSGFSLTDLVTPDPSQPHHADLMTQLVTHLGGKPVLDRPMLHISEADRRAANEFWTQHGLDRGDLVVGIHPGAGHPVRYWGLEKFGAVANAVAKKFPVRFLAISQPDGYGENLPLEAPHVKVKPNIGMLMALLEKCDVLLCNDGGPMHIAAAVGTRVVAVFGPTEPNWWAPYGPNHAVVILEGFPCRPCGDKCKFNQPYCMTDLSVPTVISALEGRLASLSDIRKGGIAPSTSALAGQELLS